MVTWDPTYPLAGVEWTWIFIVNSFVWNALFKIKTDPCLNEKDSGQRDAICTVKDDIKGPLHDNKFALTCPFAVCLLFSLTFAKDTDSFIQWAPKLGDSGCTYTGYCGGSSAFPPGTQSPFTYFHLQNRECFLI